jgi:5-methyltetrahydrofolate--homocysteine methyltransferase
MHTILSSLTREVVIGDDQPFCIIGERINPTGRKIFQEQLRAGDLSRIYIDVAQQVAGGATVLDVNMGVPLADETELMIQAVKLIQSLSDLPLCIDSSVIEALEAGLATYQGKALVNSVTAEDDRLEAILPLVKRYRAAIIALPNDEFEIPYEPERRLELARKIVDVATNQYGIVPRRQDTRDHRDDSPRARSQYDPRRLQCLFWHARPCDPRCNVFADRDAIGTHERHHGRSLAAVGASGPSGRSPS